MDDLISRESLLKKISYANADSEFDKEWIPIARRWIKNELPVEAVPVIHAEWRHIGGDEWCCSECGNVISTEGSWEKPTGKFCEECGADMRKKV